MKDIKMRSFQAGPRTQKIGITHSQTTNVEVDQEDGRRE